MSLEAVYTRKHAFRTHSFPIKIYNYNLQVEDSSLKTINLDFGQDNIKKRGIRTTSKEFYYPRNSMELKNNRSQKKKQAFSSYISNEILNLQKDPSRDDQDDERNKTKIRELKQIMRQKSKLIHHYQIDYLQGIKNRTQFKSHANTISVHSREHEYSPYTRSNNLKNQFHYKRQEQSHKYSSKYENPEPEVVKDKRFLLKGGKIIIDRNIATTHPVSLNQNLTKRKPKTVQSYSRYNYSNNQKSPFFKRHDNSANLSSQFENDCKPWELTKQNHIYQEFQILK